MFYNGMLLAAMSGLCNGLFSVPMKMETRWKWENIWFGFICVACVFMPLAIVTLAVPDWWRVYAASTQGALVAAIAFGFLWGFGAICFGRSVDRLGVSVANTLVIGLSSALGSLVPLLMTGRFEFGRKELTLLIGISIFLCGVLLCGKGGRSRDVALHVRLATPDNTGAGYIFAIVSGVLSAIFNIGYTLALPIADAGVALGQSRFGATNCIWLLMLGAGAIPNLVYCVVLMRRNKTARLLVSGAFVWPWMLSVLMGLLWGGSIFIYGAATPRLGRLGTSVGWPVSLAVGLVVANAMGYLLGEWKDAPKLSKSYMRSGIAALLCAIVLCAFSLRVGA